MSDLCVCGWVQVGEESEGMKGRVSMVWSMLYRQSKVALEECHTFEAMDSRVCCMSAMGRYRDG
jgi:hypothetical protein